MMATEIKTPMASKWAVRILLECFLVKRSLKCHIIGNVCFTKVVLQVFVQQGQEIYNCFNADGSTSIAALNRSVIFTISTVCRKVISRKICLVRY